MREWQTTLGVVAFILFVAAWYGRRIDVEEERTETMDTLAVIMCMCVLVAIGTEVFLRWISDGRS